MFAFFISEYSIFSDSQEFCRILFFACTNQEGIFLTGAISNGRVRDGDSGACLHTVGSTW